MSEHARIPSRLFSGPGPKALVVGMLVLCFLIPLAMLRGLVEERRGVRDLAEESILGPAGGRPELFGPFVVVPYTLVRGKEQVEGEIVVLAEELSATASLSAERRRRGIFSAPVLAAGLEFRGSFNFDSAGAVIPGARLRWREARVAMELPDVRALRDTPVVAWEGAELPLRADVGAGRAYNRSLSVPLAGTAGAAPGARRDFTARVPLRGGRSLRLLEPAGTVRLALSGNWSSPSFEGYLSPVSRSVGREGFEASWFLPESAQPLPRAVDAQALSAALARESSFGVTLLDGVDGYDSAWRAVRYGILFIIVPFAGIFLLEVLAGAKVHPVQYILIGLADCLFYLILLSLSELLPFAAAYAAAAAACSILASWYTAQVLRARRGWWLLPALGGLYLYLYAALRSEDYALLIGSAGLFGLLALAMYATRRVDWYGSRADTKS